MAKEKIRFSIRGWHLLVLVVNYDRYRAREGRDIIVKDYIAAVALYPMNAILADSSP